jgi:hypothetical protein
VSESSTSLMRLRCGAPAPTGSHLKGPSPGRPPLQLWPSGQHRPLATNLSDVSCLRVPQQKVPSGHTLPHSPQLLWSSLWVQRPPQQKGRGMVGSSVGHTKPHCPQLFGSVPCRSTHSPLHCIVPVGHGGHLLLGPVPTHEVTPVGQHSPRHLTPLGHGAAAHPAPGMEASAPPKMTPPISRSARLREMVSLASPLAKSSKRSSEDTELLPLPFAPETLAGSMTRGDESAMN